MTLYFSTSLKWKKKFLCTLYFRFVDIQCKQIRSDCIKLYSFNLYSNNGMCDRVYRCIYVCMIVL